MASPAVAVTTTVTLTLTDSSTGTATAGTVSSTVTWTHTESPTATVTASRTGTVSGSSSPTGTPTDDSRTRSASLTGATGTGTATATLTQTFTSTPTATRTQTDTSSLTGTQTLTATRTLSASPTATTTATLTQTSTGSWTATGTATESRSAGTATATQTPTSTGTPTGTLTATATSSLTVTQTQTTTGSQSVTATATVTATLTPTGTASVTTTVTPTGTASVTTTVTPTSTVAATTFTPATMSLTTTLTPTAATASVTATFTASGTRSRSTSVTGTGSPTATQTLPFTATSTATTTHSATAGTVSLSQVVSSSSSVSRPTASGTLTHSAAAATASATDTAATRSASHRAASTSASASSVTGTFVTHTHEAATATGSATQTHSAASTLTASRHTGSRSKPTVTATGGTATHAGLTGTSTMSGAGGTGTASQTVTATQSSSLSAFGTASGQTSTVSHSPSQSKPTVSAEATLTGSVSSDAFAPYIRQVAGQAAVGGKLAAPYPLVALAASPATPNPIASVRLEIDAAMALSFGLTRVVLTVLPVPLEDHAATPFATVCRCALDAYTLLSTQTTLDAAAASPFNTTIAVTRHTVAVELALPTGKSYKLCTSDGFFVGLVLYVPRYVLSLGGLPAEVVLPVEEVASAFTLSLPLYFLTAAASGGDATTQTPLSRRLVQGSVGRPYFVAEDTSSCAAANALVSLEGDDEAGDLTTPATFRLSSQVVAALLLSMAASSNSSSTSRTSLRFLLCLGGSTGLNTAVTVLHRLTLNHRPASLPVLKASMRNDSTLAASTLVLVAAAAANGTSTAFTFATSIVASGRFSLAAAWTAGAVAVEICTVNTSGHSSGTPAERIAALTLPGDVSASNALGLAVVANTSHPSADGQQLLLHLASPSTAAADNSLSATHLAVCLRHRFGASDLLYPVLHLSVLTVSTVDGVPSMAIDAAAAAPPPLVLFAPHVDANGGLLLPTKRHNAAASGGAWAVDLAAPSAIPAPLSSTSGDPVGLFAPSVLVSVSNSTSCGSSSAAFLPRDSPARTDLPWLGLLRSSNSSRVASEWTLDFFLGDTYGQNATYISRQYAGVPLTLCFHDAPYATTTATAAAPIPATLDSAFFATMQPLVLELRFVIVGFSHVQRKISAAQSVGAAVFIADESIPVTLEVSPRFASDAIANGTSALLSSSRGLYVGFLLNTTTSNVAAAFGDTDDVLACLELATLGIAVAPAPSNIVPHSAWFAAFTPSAVSLAARGIAGESVFCMASRASASQQQQQQQSIFVLPHTSVAVLSMLVGSGSQLVPPQFAIDAAATFSSTFPIAFNETGARNTSTRIGRASLAAVEFVLCSSAPPALRAATVIAFTAPFSSVSVSVDGAALSAALGSAALSPQVQALCWSVTGDPASSSLQLTAGEVWIVPKPDAVNNTHMLFAPANTTVGSDSAVAFGLATQTIALIFSTPFAALVAPTTAGGASRRLFAGVALTNAASSSIKPCSGVPVQLATSSSGGDDGGDDAAAAAFTAVPVTNTTGSTIEVAVPPSWARRFHPAGAIVCFGLFVTTDAALSDATGRPAVLVDFPFAAGSVQFFAVTLHNISLFQPTQTRDAVFAFDSTRFVVSVTPAGAASLLPTFLQRFTLLDPVVSLVLSSSTTCQTALSSLGAASLLTGGGAFAASELRSRPTVNPFICARLLAANVTSGSSSSSALPAGVASPLLFANLQLHFLSIVSVDGTLTALTSAAPSTALAAKPAVAMFASVKRTFLLEGVNLERGNAWEVQLFRKARAACDGTDAVDVLGQLTNVQSTAMSLVVSVTTAASQLFQTACVTFFHTDGGKETAYLDVSFFVAAVTSVGPVLPTIASSTPQQQQEIVGVSGVAIPLPINLGTVVGSGTTNGSTDTAALLAGLSFLASNSSLCGSLDEMVRLPHVVLPSGEALLNLRGNTLTTGRYHLCMAVNLTQILEAAAASTTSQRRVRTLADEPTADASTSSLMPVGVAINIIALKLQGFSLFSNNSLGALVGYQLDVKASGTQLTSAALFIGATDTKDCTSPGSITGTTAYGNSRGLAQFGGCDGREAKASLPAASSLTPAGVSMRLCLLIVPAGETLPDLTTTTAAFDAGLTLLVGSPTGLAILQQPSVSIAFSGQLDTQPIVIFVDGNTGQRLGTVPTGTTLQAQWFTVFPVEENTGIGFAMTSGAGDAEFDFAKAPQPVQLQGGKFSYRYILRFSVTGSSGGGSGVFATEVNSTQVRLASCSSSLLWAQPFSSACLTCPANAICDGTENLKSSGSFWRYSNLSRNFYSCPVDACLGNTSTGTCKEGYTGPLCSVCTPGYGRSLLACVSCNGRTEVSWVIVILAVSVLALIFAVLVFSTLQCKKSDQLPIYIKIFLNHCTIASTVGQFSTKLDYSLRTALQIQQTVTQPSPDFASFSCATDSSWHTQFILVNLIPIMASVFVMLILAVRTLRLKMQEQARLEEADIAKLEHELQQTEGGRGHHLTVGEKTVGANPFAALALTSRATFAGRKRHQFLGDGTAGDGKATNTDEGGLEPSTSGPFSVPIENKVSFRGAAAANQGAAQDGPLLEIVPDMGPAGATAASEGEASSHTPKRDAMAATVPMDEIDAHRPAAKKEGASSGAVSIRAFTSAIAGLECAPSARVKIFTDSVRNSVGAPSSPSRGATAEEDPHAAATGTEAPLPEGSPRGDTGSAFLASTPPAVSPHQQRGRKKEKLVGKKQPQPFLRVRENKPAAVAEAGAESPPVLECPPATVEVPPESLETMEVDGTTHDMKTDTKKEKKQQQQTKASPSPARKGAPRKVDKQGHRLPDGPAPDTAKDEAHDAKREDDEDEDSGDDANSPKTIVHAPQTKKQQQTKASPSPAPRRRSNDDSSDADDNEEKAKKEKEDDTAAATQPTRRKPKAQPPAALAASVKEATVVNPLDLSAIQTADGDGGTAGSSGAFQQFDSQGDLMMESVDNAEGTYALDVPDDDGGMRRRRSTVLGLLDLHGAVMRQDNIHIFAVTMVIILFLTYPSILSWDANILRCEAFDFGELQVDGSYVSSIRHFFFFDRSVECTSPTHQQYVLVGIAFGVIYAVGTPLMAASLFIYFRRPRAKGGIGRRDASRMFTFLIAGYRREVWWWEAPALIRKASLIYIAAFLQSNPGMQTLLAFWVLVVYLVGHMVVQPYEYETVDLMERFSLIIICVTLNLSLTYSWFDTASPDHVAYGIIITILLLTLHLVFILWILRAILIEGTIKVQKFVRDSEELLLEYFSDRIVAFLMEHVAYKTPAVVEITEDGNLEMLDELTAEEKEIVEIAADSGSDYSDDDESGSAAGDALNDRSNLNATVHIVLNSGSSFVRPGTGAKRKASTALGATFGGGSRDEPAAGGRRQSRAASISVDAAVAAAAEGNPDGTGRVWRARSLVASADAAPPQPFADRCRSRVGSAFTLDTSSPDLAELRTSASAIGMQAVPSIMLGSPQPQPFFDPSTGAAAALKRTSSSPHLAKAVSFAGMADSGAHPPDRRPSSTSSLLQHSASSASHQDLATEILVDDLGAVIEGMQQHTDDLLQKYGAVTAELDASKRLVADLRAEITLLCHRLNRETTEIIRRAERIISLEETINSLKAENASLSMMLRRNTEDTFLDGDADEQLAAAMALVQRLTEERNQLLQRLAQLDMEGRGSSGSSISAVAKAALKLGSHHHRMSRLGAPHNGNDSPGSLSLTGGSVRHPLDHTGGDFDELPHPDGDDDDDDGFSRPRSQKAAPPVLDAKIRQLQEAAEAENAARDNRMQEEREAQLRHVEEQLRKKRDARTKSQLMRLSAFGPSAAAAAAAAAGGGFPQATGGLTLLAPNAAAAAAVQAPSPLLPVTSSGHLSPAAQDLGSALSEALFGGPLLLRQGSLDPLSFGAQQQQQQQSVASAGGGVSLSVPTVSSPSFAHAARARRSIVEVLQNYEQQYRSEVSAAAGTPKSDGLLLGPSSSSGNLRDAAVSSPGEGHMAAGDLMQRRRSQQSPPPSLLTGFQAFPPSPLVEVEPSRCAAPPPDTTDGQRVIHPIDTTFQSPLLFSQQPFPDVASQETRLTTVSGGRPTTGSGGRPMTGSGGRRVYNNIPDSALQQAFPAEKFAAVEDLDSGRVLVVKKRHNKISQRAGRWF